MAGAAAPGASPGQRGPAGPETASRWRCPEHSEREAELFCRRCRRCVCTLCPVLGAHQGHPVGLARDEAAHVQKLVQECLKQLATKKQQQVGNIHQMEDTAVKIKAQAESSKAWLTKKFAELRMLLEEEEGMAKTLIDKNTQLAFQAYRDQIESCGKQIDTINDLSSRVYGISQESSPLQLLQDYMEMEQKLKQQMSLGEPCPPQPVSFGPIKSFFKDLTEAVETVLQVPLEVRLKENMKDQPLDFTGTKPVSLLKTRHSPDRSLLLKYARTPTLDPDTMHSRLRTSEDLLRVQCRLLCRLGPAPALRFNALLQVLSRDCFAAGRHYWEVDVQEAGAGWWVGAAYPSMQRHGSAAAARLGCNRQSWCLKRFEFEYWAFHDCQRSRLQPRSDPDRLGVFLDYEAGVLAFYDVTDGMRHLHTFRAAFQEPLYPALRLWEGAIAICRLP
ncbi:tripartite motif-containing protein 14 [Erinaceus europaeus]|uniref:Tripartite motif-containing protein 14 n=1 Tax=Erinaceus europaeus TaxID=9365 RepID=A0ABM3Y209_ERIEU|nr:tripartite motif-containing protein 14 [Erinaceus europaeus]